MNAPTTNAVITTPGLNETEAITYTNILERFNQRLLVTPEDFKIFHDLQTKINEEKIIQERAPKLEAFKAQAAELVTLGYKMKDLIKILAGGTEGNTNEIVVAIFPEIEFNKTPFEWKANKKYAARGDEAEIIKTVKGKGLDYFMKHLTEAGKKWIEEFTEINRKDDQGNKKKKFANLEKVQAMFPATPTPKPEAKTDAKPAAAAAKTITKK